MKILSIETSCDETAIAVIEANDDINRPDLKILGNSLISQIDIHREYGGVYPTLARREHAKNLIPLLVKTLKEAFLYEEDDSNLSEETLNKLRQIFSKEPDLYENFISIVPKIKIPSIDLISFTEGPGLAPALWVGISFAEALKLVWNIPTIPINHMEGHIWSVLYNSINAVEFPVLALLISGGHTELVYLENYKNIKILGKTKDDAVGEAFDKVARLLGLPYPGGPEISKLAAKFRASGKESSIIFPQPMIHSPNLDFSFSGLKTSVLYKVNSLGPITPEIQEEVAYSFEEAAVSVLLSKVKKALETYPAKTLIVGGGVIANKYLRERLESLKKDYNGLNLMLPQAELATDNAVMIAITAWIKVLGDSSLLELGAADTSFKALANLSL